MLNKEKLRKKYFFIRKKKYFEIKPSFFSPLIELIKKKNIKKISIYPVITPHFLKLMFLNYMSQTSKIK